MDDTLEIHLERNAVGELFDPGTQRRVVLVFELPDGPHIVNAIHFPGEPGFPEEHSDDQSVQNS